MRVKRLQPMAARARRRYVEAMFQVLGRALQAVSEVDANVQGEARVLPAGFMFEMKVMPRGSALVVEHTGEGRFRYHGSSAPKPVNLSIQFKHLAHAFLVLSFQEKTSVAFAHDRMLVDGDISHAVRMTRILNRLEAFILPRVIASRAVKQYPANLHLPEKLLSGAKIYLNVANQFVHAVRA
ncbi:hypothetical protein [Marinobacter sp. X15-166B]|uniref:hypothetical protein n=1 Tax=Marinobacter sp. X15-166B TaxID=1897620 RepID=UPI00085C34C9|nr:hypothetical protein [Marinobacter sp. X15-166B]OEY67307.1 hypothetical protein BG841_13225 [Marinobacter sp. X15-166B]